MGELVEHLFEQADEPATPRAPALPIEAPLVRAVRALEALKVQADIALLLLEHVPGSGPQITAAVNEAVARVNAASAACWEFQTIRSCEGQA